MWNCLGYESNSLGQCTTPKSWFYNLIEGNNNCVSVQCLLFSYNLCNRERYSKNLWIKLWYSFWQNCNLKSLHQARCLVEKSIRELQTSWAPSTSTGPTPHNFASVSRHLQKVTTPMELSISKFGTGNYFTVNIATIAKKCWLASRLAGRKGSCNDLLKCYSTRRRQTVLIFVVYHNQGKGIPQQLTAHWN